MKHLIYAFFNSLFGTYRWNQKLIPLAFLFLFTLGANAQLVNIPVTGFNNDIVANGTGTGAPGSMPGVTFPAIGFDGGVPAASSLIDNTFRWSPAGLSSTCFMPPTNVAASARTNGLTYQLQSYSANNALTIDNNSTTYASPFSNSGTLTLSAPATYTTLFVLYESAVNVGTLNVDVTVTFTDASTQVFSGNTLQNWNFFNSNVAFGGGISMAQNVSPGTPGSCLSSSAPFLFELPLVMNAANLTKQVQSVTFTIPTTFTSGTTPNRVNYFHALALGGRAACTAPMQGNYTIDNTQFTGGTNFSSFPDFAAALLCSGVSGPVIATVGGNSAYDEQVEFGTIPGASAVNTITINGNGKRITKTLIASATNIATMSLNNTSYLTVNNLQIDGLGSTFGFGVLLRNNSTFNTFSNCTINVSITATSSGANNTSTPVVFSGSSNSTANPGVNGSNNTFIGCTVSGGRNGFIMNGDGSNALNVHDNNIINCTIRDWDVNGINIQNGVNNCIISGNILERPFRNVFNGQPVAIVVGGSGGVNCLNVQILNNKIRNLWGGNPLSTVQSTGIQVSQVATPGNENKIIGNLISDIFSRGAITCISTQFNGAGYLVIAHNTIDIEDTTTNATAQLATTGINYSLATGSANVSVYNNVIKINRGGISKNASVQSCLTYASTPFASNFNDLVVTPPQFISAPGATNVTTTITVASTGNLAAGMQLYVIGGTGAFPAGAAVSGTPTATTFVSTQAPTIPLSAGAVVMGTTHYIGQITGAAIPNQPTLAGLKFQNPTIDQGSFSVDPGFVNPAGGNYQPTAAALNNIGTPVGSLTDITNAPRSPVAPDPGAYEFTPVGTDGLIQWFSPVQPALAGLQTVTVRIVNTMDATITSVNLTYALNSVDQQTQDFTGLNIPAGGSALFSFSTQFNLAAGANLTARINTVNGAPDAISANNNTGISLCPSLSGVYTIDPSLAAGGTNFQTFAALNAALSCGGVGGPVTVNVAAGNYNEQVEFKQFVGSSSTNTVTINGNDVSYSGAATSASVGTTITVGSTAGLSVGMTVAVMGGASLTPGAFSGITKVASITDATHFEVTVAPTSPLSIGDVITGHSTTLTFTVTVPAAPGTLVLNGADNMIFQNLNVVASGTMTATFACHLWNQADNNSFSGCTFTVTANGAATNGHVPFSISGSPTIVASNGLAGNNLNVINCTMNGGSNGVVIYGAGGTSGQTISNTSTGIVIKNCSILDQSAAGLRISNCNGGIISGNIFERPNRSAATYGAYTGIILESTCFNTLVEKNLIRKTYERATAATTTSMTGISAGNSGNAGNENLIYNNVISDYGTNTSFVGGMVGFNPGFTSFYKFYHNTIAFENTLASGSTATSIGISSGSATQNMDIRNNIISIKRGGAGASYCVVYTSALPATTNSLIDFNDLYITPIPNHFIALSAGVSYSTIAAWKTAFPYLDPQSKSLDPSFTGPATGNFTPRALNLDNMCLNVGVAQDFQGTARGASPDPGAFEFSPVASDAAIAWVSPAAAPVPAGSNIITVNIANNGLTPITEVKLRYVDNAAIPVLVNQTFSGLNIVSGTNQNFSFTTAYNLASSVVLTASIQEVNGVVGDGDASNDAVSQSFCVPLSGNYTINSTLPASSTNFISFTTAITQLASCGISGPVVLDVFGSYAEQIEIPPIPGSSITNTITFNGGNRYPNAIYNSIIGATAVGTVITLPVGGTTAGLAPGMTVWVNVGAGMFASGTTVVSITDATHFVVSAAPATGLGATGVIVSAMQSTLSFTAGTSSFPTLRLTGADNLIFNNLNFLVTGTSGFACQLSNASDNNQFNGCTFTAPQISATSTTIGPLVIGASSVSQLSPGINASNNTFSACNFYGGHASVAISGAGNTAVMPNTTAGNKFLNCLMRDFTQYGLYQQSGTKGTEISKCTIERPTRSLNLSTGANMGIWLREGSENCIVNANIIRNLFGAAPASTASVYGMSLETTAALGSGITVSNNIISNIGSTAGTMTGIAMNFGTYIKVVHNTIYFNYPNYTSTLSPVGIFNQGGTTGFEIQNNIVYMAFAGTTGNTGNKYCIQLAAGTNGISALNNNDYYFKQNYVSAAGATSSGTLITVASTTGIALGMPLYVTAGSGAFAPGTVVASIIAGGTQFTASAAPTVALSGGAVVSAGSHYIGQKSGTAYPALAAWKIASPTFDQQSISADPLFISPDAPNYNYTPNYFALDNSANPVGITTDYNVAPRSLTTPDIGAIEAAMAAASDLTPVALLAPVNSGCFSSNESIVVRIKNLGNATHDFSAANATVTCNVTGAATGSFIAILTSGTLAAKATMDVTLTPTLNMSAAGSYTFAASTSVLSPGVDGDLTNNNLAPVTLSSATLTAGTVATDRTELCAGRPTLTLTGSAGGSIQWQESTTPSGPWNPAGAGTTAIYSNAASAISSGTLITVASTTGLYAGMIVTVNPGGAGVFAAATTVVSITDVNHFVVSVAPNIPLATGDFITGTIPSFTPSADLTQSMYYRANVACGANAVTSNVQNVLFNSTPQLTASSGASRCGIGPVILNASVSANSYANWYSSPTSSYPVYSGNASTSTNYTIPNLSATATYYVSASFGVKNDVLGLQVPPEFPNNLFSTNNNGVVFNALKPFKIGNVDLYANASSNGQPGTVTIALQNSVGATLASKIVNVTGYVAPLSFERRSTVDLGFDVPVGTGYRLITTAMSGINGLQYQTNSILTAAIGYYVNPFNYYVPGVATLTSGWFFDQPAFLNYPTFFNISVITGCETARQAVTATFNAGPAITAGATNTLVCPGSTTQLMVLTSGNPAYTYTWTPENLIGSTVTATPALNTVYTVTATDNTAGPFAGCQTTANVTIATKPKVSVNATAVPLSVCSGGNSQLAVTASTTSSYAMTAATPSPVPASGIITTLDRNNTTGNTGGLNDGYFTVNLPFVFGYFGSSYDKAYINTNGYVSFGQGYTSFASNAQVIIPHTGDVNNSIYLAWKDWDLSTAGSIQYCTIGTAPHRIFVIKYVNVPGQVNGFPLNGQIELYEDNSKIELFLASTDNRLYTSAPGATAVTANSITTITVTSTTGLVPGMLLSVIAGNGAIFAGTPVFQILSPTQFTLQGNLQTAFTGTGVVVQGTGSFPINKTLGIENATGIGAYSPSQRNGETWTVTSPEQWEFLPFGGNLTYNWTPGVFLDDPASTTPFASFIFNTTTYTASVADAVDGCSGSGSVTVTTGDPLSAPITANPSTICAGQSSILSVTPTGGCAPYHYVWDDGTSNLGVTSFISVSPTSTTTYNITVTDDFGNEYPFSTTIHVNPLPNVTSTQGLICGSGSATLTASGAATYTWAPTTNLNIATGPSVISTTPITRTYTVTGTSALGCVNTALATVTRSYSIDVSASANPTALAVGGNSQLNAVATEIRPATTYYSLTSFSIPIADTAHIYKPLTGPGITVINTNAQLTPGFAAGNQDDGGVLINLPFAFTYFGSNFTQMSMCTNGWVAAGDWSTISAANSQSQNAIFTTLQPNNMLAGWFRNLGANFPLGAGSMRHGLTGPDTYTFQWDKVTANTPADGSAEVNSYQITIFGPASGTPGRIEYHYGPSVGMTLFQGAIAIEDAIGGTDHYLNAWTGTSNQTTAATSWPGTPTEERVYEFNPNIVNINYSWSPSTFLNNTLISNPVASGMLTSQTYTVTASNNDGCSNTASVLVEVGVPLAASASSSGNNFCELLNNTLSGTVHGGCQPYSYSWSDGTSIVGTTKNVTFAPPAGTITYTLTVTDACSGTATSAVTIIVKPAPNTAVTKSRDVCGSDPAILTATGAVTYTWSPATALNSVTGAVVTSSATSATTYTVTGTGLNSCVRSATILIDVFPAVVVNPTATPSSLCINGTSELRANASTDNGYSVTSIAHNALAPVGTPVTVAFTSPNESLVENLPLPFGFHHYGINYTTWSVSTNGYMGFGTLSNTNASQHLPNTSTPNNLIALCWGDLDVAASGSSVTYFTTGTTPNRVFVISFNNLKWMPDTIGNMSGQIQLYEGSDNIEIHLTNVDHGTSTSLNAMGIENLTGTKADTVAGRNRGLAPWDVTTPEAWRFAPIAPVYSYSWTPATFLNASTVANPTASNVTSSQSYAITVTNTATNCSASSTVAVTAGIPLVVNASALHSTACAGDANSLTVTATGGKAPYSYSWSNGTSVISTDQNISVNPLVTTTYIVTVTDFCGVATASAPVVVNVNPLPVLTITPPGGSICQGTPSSILMTASGANTYSWTPSGGLNTVSGATVVASATGNLATTVYTVTGTNTATGCVNKASATIYRNLYTTSTASATPSQVCASQASQLNSLFAVKTNPALLITEVTQSGSGSVGATSPRPSYFAATDNNFVEISNLGSGPLNVGGLTFELWIGPALSQSYNIPAGVVLQGHSVLVLHLGTGINSPANNYYHTLGTNGAGTNNPLLPSIAYGYILKSGSTILDAVATTANDGFTYSWPPASGVSAAQWSGTIPFTSNNAAGAIRVGGFDLNVAADWAYASDDNRQTLGSYNNTFGSNSQPAFTYAWSPATYLSDATLSNPVVSGSTGGTLNYTVTATDPASGCSSSASTTLTVTPLPTVTLSGPSSTCAGTGITLNFAFTGVGPWSYSFTDGTTTFGPYTSSAATATKNVTPPGAAGSVVTYTPASVSDSRCDGDASSLLGSATVTLSSYSSIDGITLTSNKPFNNICVGDNITISMNGVTAASLGTGAHWKWYSGSCIGGTPVAGSTDQLSITVNPTATTTYYVKAEGTCNTTGCVSLQVVVTSTPVSGNPVLIYTPSIAYAGASDSIVVSPVAGATFYHWTTNGNSNILFDGHAAPYESSSNKVILTFVSPSTSGNGIGNYHIQFFAGNACGTTNSTNIKIRATVDQPASVNGPLVACPGQTKTYTVSPVTGAKSYQWSVSGGGTIAGNGTQSVNVTFASLPATLCVHAVSAFGSAGPDLCVNITTVTAAPDSISGSPAPCQGGTEVYSIAPVSGAVSYNWTCSVAGAIITPNLTSASIQFPAGVFSGSVCVTANSGCASSAPTCLAVASGTTPQLGAITGPTEGVCGATSVNYQVTSIGASNYNWSLPSGASIASGQGSTSILVDFTSSYAGGLISVVSTSPCGNATQTLPVTGAPSAPGITPNEPSACAGDPVGYTAFAPGAISYTWTVSPAAGTISFQSANGDNIIVDWITNGGSVTAIATNSCGNSIASNVITPSSCRVSQNTLADILQAMVYPNPSQGKLTLQYNSPEESTYLLKVTDLTGRVLQRESLEGFTGLNRHEINLGDVAKGVYMLSLENSAGEKIVIRLVIQ